MTNGAAARALHRAREAKSWLLAPFPRLRRAWRTLRRALNERRWIASQHAHDSRSEDELLARAEEFNRNAEAHWKAIAADPSGREHVLSKPLTSAQDASSILYRLGIVLGELHLGVGQTVLDLGAGACWLSAWLNRLRCRTISMDVSQSALELGQELFRLGPRRRRELEPWFLVYDGHAIPLAGESADRVVCFDAFHHIPNQGELLREIFRVLKTGGRVVFAEPGEGHSHAGHSVFEEEHFGVLENDIDLSDLAEKARQVGFDKLLVKPYPDCAAISMTASDYFNFMGGRDQYFPTDILRESLRNFHVFTLTKGEEIADSRNPKRLRASILVSAPDTAVRGPANSTVRINVRLQNTGDTVWLDQEMSVGGYVRLAGQLVGADGQPLPVELFRVPLGRDVAPGQLVDVAVSFRLPEEPGGYLLRLDLVDEGLLWFAQTGSPTTEVRLEIGCADSRAPARLQAAIEPAGPLPQIVATGAWIDVALRLTNKGNTIWLRSAVARPGTVSVGGHLLSAGGEMLLWDLFRSPLDRDIPPGETTVITCRLQGPATAGQYRIRLDLVAEGICWFAQRGSTPLDVHLETSSSGAD